MGSEVDTEWLEGEVVPSLKARDDQAIAERKAEVQAEVDVLKSEKELARARLASIENELFERSMEIVSGALSAPGVDPSNPMAIPEEWIEEMGEKAARSKYKSAVDAHLCAKEAPVYLKVAENMAAVIIRARATEKAAPKHLNIQKVEIPIIAVEKFEEMVVEEQD